MSGDLIGLPGAAVSTAAEAILPEIRDALRVDANAVEVLTWRLARKVVAAILDDDLALDALCARRDLNLRETKR